VATVADVGASNSQFLYSCWMVKLQLKIREPCHSLVPFDRSRCEIVKGGIDPRRGLVTSRRQDAALVQLKAGLKVVACLGVAAVDTVGAPATAVAERLVIDTISATDDGFSPKDARQKPPRGPNVGEVGGIQPFCPVRPAPEPAKMRAPGRPPAAALGVVGLQLE